MKTENQIVKLQTLISDEVAVFKNNHLKRELNQEPPKQWVKRNQYANNAEYLPIDKVEFLLDGFFGQWQIEVKEVAQLFNSVRVTVRVHYFNPLDAKWYYHDGVGASDLQTKKDTGTLLADFSNVNKGACEMALPKAKTAAIKDACDHLGKLFGRDLNRKDAIEFKSKYDNEIPIELLKKGQAE